MERLVLVHGSVRNGDVSFAAQRPLADELELIVLNRPGFPPGPLAGRVDFEEHAAWVAERLRPGDHLCGHSYGGVVSLYAAARADRLSSLTVVEPPAFAIAAGRPEVDELSARLHALWRDGPREPRAFLADFYAAVSGRAAELPFRRLEPGGRRCAEAASAGERRHVPITVQSPVEATQSGSSVRLYARVGRDFVDARTPSKHEPFVRSLVRPAWMWGAPRCLVPGAARPVCA